MNIDSRNGTVDEESIPLEIERISANSTHRRVWGNCTYIGSFAGFYIVRGPGKEWIIPLVAIPITGAFFYLIHIMLSWTQEGMFLPNYILTISSIALLFFTLYVSYVDAGRVIRAPYHVDSEKRDAYYCLKCMVSRQEQQQNRIHHCVNCDKCMEFYDHHCNFLGNCISDRNKIAFYTILGLFAVSGGSAYFGLFSLLSIGNVGKTISMHGIEIPNNIT